MASTFNILPQTGRTADRSEANEASLSAQARTFVYWINLSLKSKSIRITNLYDDLESGVVLIKLMECLASGKKIPGR